MGRAVNLTYGLIIIFLALDAWLFHVIPSQFLPVGVIIMGVLVLLTPLGGGGYTQPTFAQRIIRFVFGIAMVVMGALSIYNLGGFGDIYNTYSLSGQVILILIGAIYIMSGTRTAGMQIRAT